MKQLNKKGQMTIEAILIMTLLFTVVTMAVNIIRQKNYLSQVVEQPWSYLGGMIENGIWAPRNIGAQNHPNHLKRHASPQGDLL